MRKTRRVLLSLLILMLLLGACQTTWQDVRDGDWTEEAVFYQIFVRSFYDSDGDGIGDFNGIIQKLDYLNDGNPETTADLGVTGIWLMPIHPSPSYHGYDVLDYYDVNPDYGTMDDFKNLLAEAHKRGIRVIIDYVINHTSVKHPWFRASAKGEAPYEDYYIWTDQPPSYQGPWGQSVWHPYGDRYYYGVFVADMPDLNFDSPGVNAEIEKITRFWLEEVGVDGFRIDGAKHLIEDGPVQENTPATLEWFKDFASFHKSIKPHTLVVGEIWSPSSEIAAYTNTGALDLVFNFDLAGDILSGVAFRDARQISNSLLRQQRYFDPGRYAPFLANHDQTRTMTRLGGEFPRAEAAATILLTSPGVPFIYYGEEIGMTGDKPDPNLRTPMQWTGGDNAGFSSGRPWKGVNSDYSEKNVELMMRDRDSLLSHYRDLIRVRSNHYALRTGVYVPVTTFDNNLFAMLRVEERETVLVLVNLSGETITDTRMEWGQSTITGVLNPYVLMGQGNFATLTTGEDGSIRDFQPLSEIPPHANIIIQYRR
jgi:alpha-amylase